MCHCTPAPDTASVLVLILNKITQQEEFMATATEAIAALSAQVDANSAALLDLVSDVRALITALSQEPQLTPETQAAAAAVAAKLTDDAATIGALDAEVGDADGSDTPPTP